MSVTNCHFGSVILAAVVAVVFCSNAATAVSATSMGKPPNTLRLYVMDCGAIHVADTARYELRRDEVETSELSVACFLVAHPKGALIWDVGAVPDGEWVPTGAAITHHLSLPDGQSRDITLTRTLGEQLAEIGYPPAKIRFIALSHYHYDHTANANAFAHSTWLVRAVERDAMFATPAPGTTRSDTYSGLKRAKTILIDVDQFDVFGDGSVMIKFAPGHTPGHQMLLVRLKGTGPVLLSGDLYHFPQERTLNRFPVFEFDKEQTRRSRLEVDDFLKTTGASLWIPHDFIANSKLRKAPAFYD
jgi:glyoxylase-like metal-dependent hydrolase (beta-lactamase superfamily II)